MARKKENTIRAYVFLSEADHNYLRDMAAKEGSNVSLIIRRTVKEYIEKIKKGVQ